MRSTTPWKWQTRLLSLQPGKELRLAEAIYFTTKGGSRHIKSRKSERYGFRRHSYVMIDNICSGESRESCSRGDAAAAASDAASGDAEGNADGSADVVQDDADARTEHGDFRGSVIL